MPLNTPVRGNTARVYVNGIDLSGQTTGIGFEGVVNTIDWAVLDSAAMNQMPLASSGALRHSGYYMGAAAGDLERELHALIAAGANVTVAALFDSSAYMLTDSWAGQMTIAAPVADVITVEGNWAKARSVSRGAVAWAQRNVTATGVINPDYARTANAVAGEALLLVGIPTGTLTTATFTLQHGPNAGGLVSAGTFSVTAAGVYRIALADHKALYRLNCTAMGGATNLPICLIIV